MKNKNLLPLILVLLTGLAACGEGARLELSVASEDPDVIRRTQAVLYYRLTEATRNPFANVRTGYFPESKKLVFEYDRSAPDPDSLRYLYETKGDYRLWSVDAEGEDVDWITNFDIYTVEASRSGGNGQVFIALNIDSATRLQELSLENVGATVRSTLDGDPFQELNINAPVYGRYFQFDLPSEIEAKNLAIVLRSGVLPAPVSSWQGN